MITPPHAINHVPVEPGGKPILITQPNFPCCLHNVAVQLLRTRCTDGWNLWPVLGSYEVEILSRLLKLGTFIHSYFIYFTELRVHTDFKNHVCFTDTYENSAIF